MPLDAIRTLTAPPRTHCDNIRLGAGMTFVAGATHAAALFAFVAGGVLSALGFQNFGYVAVVPLAAMPGVMSVVPALDDIRNGLR